MPKISVLMTVYNTKEEYLRTAIESILNQTFGDFEFIIINDSSTNNAKEVILSYKDDRIVYVENEENSGAAFGSNKGLKLATGDYIARLDSDDISHPTRLEKQVKFMENNPDVGILGTWFETFPKKHIIKHPTENEEIEKYMLFIDSAIGHSSAMIRKNLIDEFDINYEKEDEPSEDYGVWLSLINKTKFANLPEVLMDYRLHHSSLSSVNRDTQMKNSNKLRFRAQSKFLRQTLDEEFRIAEKIRKKEKLTAEEMITYINYLNLLAKNLGKYAPKYLAHLRHLYKKALKLCPKNPKFLKELLTSPTTKILNITFTNILL